MTAQIVYRQLLETRGRGDPFDRHLFACALAVAVAEGNDIGFALGLSAPQLGWLIAAYFPDVRKLAKGDGAEPASPEEPALRALLLDHRSNPRVEQDWLAAIIARRSLRPNHLWQDLGLRSRNDLSMLMRRHFAPLAAANDRDMKWKKFFYRRLCQDENVAICKSPVCDACDDFGLCFGDEPGASLVFEPLMIGAAG